MKYDTSNSDGNNSTHEHFDTNNFEDEVETDESRDEQKMPKIIKKIFDLNSKVSPNKSRKKCRAHLPNIKQTSSFDDNDFIKYEQPRKHVESKNYLLSE